MAPIQAGVSLPGKLRSLEGFSLTVFIFAKDQVLALGLFRSHPHPSDSISPAPWSLAAVNLAILFNQLKLLYFQAGLFPTLGQFLTTGGF